MPFDGLLQYLWPSVVDIAPLQLRDRGRIQTVHSREPEKMMHTAFLDLQESCVAVSEGGSTGLKAGTWFDKKKEKTTQM